MGPLLSALGAGIALAVIAALSLHLPGSIWAGSERRLEGVVALLAGATLLYFAATALVLRVGLPRRSFWLIVAVAILLRASLLLAPPFMSSDIYRYVWDGRVQAAGINPYRYVPADPALMPLRDAAIYPRINRSEYARTIYPPAAQLLFAAVGRVSQTVWATKLALSLVEAAGMLAVLRLLAIAGLPRERLLIYAWNPLAAWSVAGDGHIDGAAIGFLGLAMLACAARRDGLAGGLLGAAILTKFLPLALAPALWRHRGHDWNLRMPLVTIATIVALYALYLSVGWKVLGFLPGYAKEEGLAAGSGFWLLRLLGRAMPLPGIASAAYLACGLGLLAAAALWIAFVQPAASNPRAAVLQLGGNAAILAAGTMAVLSPHYPWYYAWLALPSMLRPWRSVIYLSAAPVLLYCDPLHDRILFPSLVFIPAGLLALWDWRLALAAEPPRAPPEGAVP